MSDQVEPTRVLAVGDPADEATVNIAQAQIDADRQAAEEEAQRQAEEARARQAERAARERALGAVPVSSADEDVTPQPIPEPDNDRFFPSLGLTLLRLVLAGFLGVRGVQIIFDINGTTTWLDDRYVPFPDIVAWLLGVFLLIFAAMLVIGFGTRVVGVLVAALAIAVLVYIRWGYSSVFAEGQPGFVGDTELLVAGAGFVLLCLGSGGWAIDAGMRRGRAQRRYYQ